MEVRKPAQHLAHAVATSVRPCLRRHPLRDSRWISCLLVAGALLAHAGTVPATDDSQASAPKANRESTAPRPLDRTGKKRVGKASFYAGFFAGRKMADGSRMDPHDDNAASKTLPLGTTARVTNLETGKSAVVTIQDRGPYVPGRIVDLSPSTARQIGITPKIGVAPVEVAPIAVPLPEGGTKTGEGAHEGDPATRTAER
jgi:rare lipoprotein A